MHLLVAYIQVAENQFWLELTRKVDGVLDENQSIVAAEEDFTFSSLNSGWSVEIVCQHALFFGPILETVCPGIEAHQGIFRADNQIIGMRAGQNAEDVVGQ